MFSSRSLAVLRRPCGCWPCRVFSRRTSRPPRSRSPLPPMIRLQPGMKKNRRPAERNQRRLRGSEAAIEQALAQRPKLSLLKHR